MDNSNWRFCAVGNIKPQHTDANGTVRYGTKAFSGGSKIYICDTTLDLHSECITVLGRNRFSRYVIEGVPIDLLENIRIQSILKPTVLEIMDYLNAADGWTWRGRTSQDKKEINAFIERVNKL